MGDAHPWSWWDVLGHVRVGPFRITTDWMTKADQKKYGAAGAFFADDCKIVIKSDIDSDCLRETLLHEILHACIRVSGFDDEDAEEKVISAIAPTLLDVLQRNPKLVRYLRFGE